jgi:hypothetical protein
MAEFLPFYTGDAGLGLGGNADIPVSYGQPLETTNQTIRDVALRDSQKNMFLFQQKVKDRDKMYELLDSGEVKLGDILERDMPVVNKALDRQTEAFNEWMKKGAQDPAGAMAYKKATREAQQAATQAQYRKHYYDQESDNLSKERLPKFAEARKAHMEKNLSSFWADATPFQQFSTLDVNPIVGFSKPIETILPDDPTKPYQKGKRTYYSYDDALKNAQNYGLTPEGSFNLKTFHDTLTEMPPLELADKIKTVNQELARYNQQRGLKPGDKDFVTPIQAVPQVGKDGKLSMVGINEPLDKLAAKFSLAQHPQYQTDTFDIDKGKLDLFKAQSGRISAQAAATRAGAYAALQNKKLKDLNEDEKRVKGFWDGVVDRVGEFKSNTGNKVDFLWLGNLPKGYTYMAGVDAKGQPIALKPFTFTDNKGKTSEYYQPRYRNTQTGENIAKDFLNDKFKTYKDAGGKGDYNTYLRSLIKSGVVDLELAGENGTADFESALQSARALSNKVGAGKEEPVYSETEPQPEE